MTKQGTTGQAISLSDFSYELPEELIAQEPQEPRDQSRLMLLDREKQSLSNHVFRDIVEHLEPGDLVVYNNTKVFPARLQVVRPSGSPAELCFVEPVDGDYKNGSVWRALGKPAKAMKAGSVLRTDWGAELEVVERQNEFVVLNAFEPLLPMLRLYGALPLPPYIKRPQGEKVSDQDSYQTVFAEAEGAVAAPTAGLHFTPEVCAKLQEKGVAMEPILLHVGPGTFLPIRREHEEDIRSHQMHAEFYSIPESTLDKIEKTRQKGGRIIAVGTTSVRTLESWAINNKREAYSDLFIFPGFDFKVVDAMVTNFHLPESTLVLLVSAFAGQDFIFRAYEHAIKEKYRFFSYGDAMFIS